MSCKVKRLTGVDELVVERGTEGRGDENQR